MKGTLGWGMVTPSSETEIQTLDDSFGRHEVFMSHMWTRG